ncbi:MAG: threonine--tRNA ligase [Desulfobulbaceae bacterium]|nr:MAG: threonine--tRNA ligase [Desulfobulbaceae bacterium]
MAEITLSTADQRKSFPVGISAAEVLKEMFSNKVRKRTLALRVGGVLIDLSAPLTTGGELVAITPESPEALDLLRHSAAHVMAEAVLDLFGHDIQVAIGPATADGFYYDFDRNQSFTPEDLEKIETRMERIASADRPFGREEVARTTALEFFCQQGQRYKVELLEEIATDRVSLYRQGSFVDLCRGPHLPSTGWIKAIKLTRLAGAYWRGDEKKPMLQRIYGTAFFDKKELRDYLNQLEEAKKRDHRKLGRELELFTIQDQIGPGLILWQPKGSLLRWIIEDYWRREHYRHGYELLSTPHIARRELWSKSGHLDFYAENMFSAMDVEDVRYQLKPMNCPFHLAIYQTRKRSYRELPLRWCELGTVYRFEKTGALHGLMRVRGFTQDDAHIFCRPDQLEAEIYRILDFNLQILQAFGFVDYDIYLSTRPEKYVGSDAHWERATEALKVALAQKGLPYTVDPGEGVFYGPKIDIKIKDVLGRAWQCSTIQVDFNLPERFNLGYTGEDGAEYQPIMIHRALMGSLERFLGVLIEHYAGAFPVWLAPVQARICNITDAQLSYAAKLYEDLRRAGVRVEQDIRNEKLNYKIRVAQMQKIPYMLIVGDQEMASDTVTVRRRDGKNLAPMPVDEFVALVMVEKGRKTTI